MSTNTKPALVDYRKLFAATRDKTWGIPLRLSERKLLLAAIDLGILNGALLITLTLRGEAALTDLLLLRGYSLVWFITLNILWMAVGAIFDIYNLAKAASAIHSLWATVCTALITTTSYLLIPYITPSLPASRFEALALVAMVAAGISVWRVLYASLLVQPAFQQRALIIGAGCAGAALVRSIKEMSSPRGNPYNGTGYQLIGFIDDDPGKLDTHVEGVPVIGTHHDIRQFVKEFHPDEIIIAITCTQDINPDLFQAILDCHEMGVPITTMAALYERLTGKVPVEQAGQDLAIVLPTKERDIERVYHLARRLVDIGVGAIGCLVLAFVTPLVWLGNRLFSPGPVFYSQNRIGYRGRTFRIVKYRSMVTDAEQRSGAVWATKNDPRITPMGRFLRLSRLDEIPQLLNVLKGDMSLIGPRPERPEFVNQLAREIPYYRARHAVKPGLTGWAQVKYRYGASVNDALIKLQYDLYYIKNQSLFLDIQIILKTIKVVLLFKGQ
ncbi:MAG: sugar transferase [Chloroflexi bacterium]|nr:sugar transferase [Chloroflexota bacterium]